MQNSQSFPSLTDESLRNCRHVFGEDQSDLAKWYEGKCEDLEEADQQGTNGRNRQKGV